MSSLQPKTGVLLVLHERFVARELAPAPLADARENEIGVLALEERARPLRAVHPARERSIRLAEVVEAERVEIADAPEDCVEELSQRVYRRNAPLRYRRIPPVRRAVLREEH